MNRENQKSAGMAAAAVPRRQSSKHHNQSIPIHSFIPHSRPVSETAIAAAAAAAVVVAAEVHRIGRRRCHSGGPASWGPPVPLPLRPSFPSTTLTIRSRSPDSSSLCGSDYTLLLLLILLLLHATTDRPTAPTYLPTYTAAGHPRLYNQMTHEKRIQSISRNIFYSSAYLFIHSSIH
eukprot:GHVU01012875.1.p1 GENE.GHVU01012875.1~~GHVU01012875.1.p1  ORF type:complete len:177 (-),score=18.20 GHVU01012875.1:179-709(-)